MTPPFVLIIDSSDPAGPVLDQCPPGFDCQWEQEPSQVLDILARQEQGAVVLSPCPRDQDDTIGQILGKLSDLQVQVVVILICGTDEILKALELGNRLGVFRILIRGTEQDAMIKALNDASRQLTLLASEQRLRTRVSQLISVDPLTGCLKEQALQQRLAAELQRSIRYTHYLSLFVCRIDGDTHPTKDVLQAMAELARTVLRDDVDLLSRFNDDSFLVVLPETPIWGAGTVAERLRQRVEKNSAEMTRGQTAFTVSIGVTGYAPEVPDWNNTLENLLLVGANCLNQARSSGGNAVLLCP